MTAKEKVLKIEPDAMCWYYHDEDENKTTCWISIGSDGNKNLSQAKTRESWALAQAYRNLIK